MKRSHGFNRHYKSGHKEINKEIAIHEAGHAAGIYLGNKQKNLPAVYFKIYINHLNSYLNKYSCKYTAKIEGGRLIHTLPYNYSEAIKGLADDQESAYKRAFEADIVNILIGALAEAKYVSLRDDEAQNIDLVNLESLHFYGGSSDLTTIHEYLDCYIDNDDLKKDKMSELFQAALVFLNKQSNWMAITTLAEAILALDKHIIEYELIVDALEHGCHIMRTHAMQPPNFFHTKPIKQALLESDVSLLSQSSVLCGTPPTMA